MSLSDGSPSRLNDFERLVDEYGDRIYAAALRITGSPQDAEDVLQETFLQAFEHRGAFRGEASPTTWLYRIAVNAALVRLRQRRPTSPLTDDGYDNPRVADWSNDLGRQVELGELRDELERGLGRLPEDLRVAVVLRDVEGFSIAEVARIVEQSEAAVKSRVHRGRVLLRQLLATYLRA
jgi:RNA polymerase sigma-70 factor (ECF subfamily)